MGLADLAERPRPSKRAETCATGLWIDEQDEDKQAGLKSALERRFPVTSIWEEACADGYPYNYNAFLVHVNGRCICVSR